MESLNTKRKNDLILIAGLILAAMLVSAILFFTRQTGGKVAVIQDGKQIAEYGLNKNQSITIPAPNGGENTFIIADGTVKMTDANCPDKLCVHQPEISYNGQTIVCLPHKLVLKIISEENPEVDVTV